MTSKTLDQHSLADRISIVLVEPKQSLNVGAVARAMKNLGFSDLRIVAPQYEENKTWVTARSAEELIRNDSVFACLDTALADFTIVYGLSARDSLNRHGRLTLRECAPKVLAEMQHKSAFVFGPEATGLRKEHLDLCTHLVRIPTSSDFESLNLAQAAILVMYELIRDLEPKQEDRSTEEMAQMKEMYQLESLLDDSAKLCGFYGKGTPSHIPSVVHNLIKRIEPTKNESAVLLGLFSKIRKALLGEIPINKG